MDCDWADTAKERRENLPESTLSQALSEAEEQAAAVSQAGSAVAVGSGAAGESGDGAGGRKPFAKQPSCIAEEGKRVGSVRFSLGLAFSSLQMPLEPAVSAVNWGAHGTANVPPEMAGGLSVGLCVGLSVCFALTPCLHTLSPHFVGYASSPHFVPTLCRKRKSKRQRCLRPVGSSSGQWCCGGVGRRCEWEKTVCETTQLYRRRG
jgi:hypothetical protein